MKVIDISRDIFKTPVYPGDPEPYFDEVRKIKDGDECNLTAFYTCLHTATHIDAPLHFVDGAPSIEQIPIELFVGECTVVEVPECPITGEYVEEKFPRGKERVLVKGNGKAAFLESAAFAAVDCGIKLIGTDSASVGMKGQQAKTHRAFENNNVVILEGLDLEGVKPGNYFLIAPPIKISEVEAAPARAILIADYLFWSGV